MSVNWGILSPTPNAGEALRIRVRIKDESGTALDITGYEFEFWIENVDDPDDVQDVTEYAEIESYNPGVITLSLPRAFTKGLGGREYKGECWRTNNGDAVLAEGIIPFDEVIRDVDES